MFLLPGHYWDHMAFEKQLGRLGLGIGLLSVFQAASATFSDLLNDFNFNSILLFLNSITWNRLFFWNVCMFNGLRCGNISNILIVFWVPTNIIHWLVSGSLLWLLSLEGKFVEVFLLVVGLIIFISGVFLFQTIHCHLSLVEDWLFGLFFTYYSLEQCTCFGWEFGSQSWAY